MPAANVIDPIHPLANDMKLVLLLYQNGKLKVSIKTFTRVFALSLNCFPNTKYSIKSLKHQELGRRYIVNVQQICKIDLGKKKFIILFEH